MMRHIDLCSGIGGFALGFEWAGLSRPAMFCDIEPWSRKILAKHWPDVPIEEDVKVLANEPEKISAGGRDTILTAGYPCQPFSQAGKRLGAEDDRHIWPHIREIVAQKRPAWCVFENVYGHVSMGLDQVLLDLETDLFAARCFIVPACGVDAPHRRDRVWIVARNVADTNDPRNRTQQHDTDAERQAASKRRQEQSQPQSSRYSENVANTDSQRGCGWNASREDAGYARKSPRGQGDYPGRVETWKPEPPVGRVANGVPRRVDRLKGLGNAIVPKIAMQIGIAIRQCEASATGQ